MRNTGVLAILGLLVFGAGPAFTGSLDYALGKALFDRLWTSAPASTDATDGLGPLFNARSCASCHPKGGRGRFTEDGAGRISGTGLVLRLGDAAGADDPVYGHQLQTLAVQGLKAEGRLVRTPSGALGAEALTYGALQKTIRMSGRLAPDLHGVGMLQNVPAAAILEWADPDDADNNGVSGRPNYAYDATGERVLSRFGWKADKATLRVQSASALNIDLGLSNPVYPRHFGDCTDAQADCLAAPHGASPHLDNLEIDAKMLDLIVTFVANLAPRQSRRNKEGQALFGQVGCAVCHRPELPQKNGGTIAPYTDLLLHDMGDKLADGIGDAEATGREWRTAPLWGLGYAERYLHDGHVRSLREAVELHGGEAESARNAFRALDADRQERLLTFLSNL